MKLQFPIKNTRDYMSSAIVLSAFSQEGNIFSTCCSNSEVLLDFKGYHHSEFLSCFLDQLLNLPGRGVLCKTSGVSAGHFSSREKTLCVCVCVHVRAQERERERERERDSSFIVVLLQLNVMCLTSIAVTHWYLDAHIRHLHIF
jgi:hypothetical protein